ncbi:uncharacterized protein LOC126365883 [Schistocerca gregaria]|uniref:uncharacterized protein LOC126365883 n=1 Tax=Schistocerca gregaria TaxID=7010 RepID=UPI00211DDAC1|nr:uncharacterized protein LOC126365883 [Schistocerca gregaria]
MELTSTCRTIHRCISACVRKNHGVYMQLCEHCVTDCCYVKKEQLRRIQIHQRRLLKEQSFRREGLFKKSSQIIRMWQGPKNMGTLSQKLEKKLLRVALATRHNTIRDYSEPLEYVQVANEAKFE